MNISWILIFFSLTLFARAEKVGKEEEKVIRGLIENLVFTGGDPKTKEYKKRYERCQTSFKKLMEFKGKSLPFLVEHLADKRSSIHFRNHFGGSSVGNACHWNIYFQLQDQPANYSEYGYQRKGKDGENHPKPYWEGSPFDDAGGAKEWLKANEKLSYVEMQIKCLNWLLEREKKIGVPDADSYFLNILPLEIRVLERKLEAGQKVEGELKRLREILKKRDLKGIPDGVLTPITPLPPDSE